jgi:peroxiredoxin
MNRFLVWICALAGLADAAWAGLDVGEKAPDFTAPAVLAGKPFDFSLAASLAKGPVVLYFFPAAFSEGCSIEAHEFAEAAAQYQALGATVIGVSGDDVETLGKFSKGPCQGAFPVASDEKMSVIEAYDPAMTTRPDYANRISYVIAPDGSIVYSYLSLNPHRHVEKTLGALREWGQAKARK